MSTKSCQEQPPRIPFPVEGIQVNGCRNPTCESFLALTPIKNIDERGDTLTDAYQRGEGPYRISGTGKGTASVVCLKCSENKQNGLETGQVSTSLKSNQAVYEELRRISRHLETAELRCPNHSCETNIGNKPVSVKKNGRTSSGNQRLICLECRKSFTEKPKSRKHTKSHVEKMLFKLLVSKTPLARIAFVLDIAPQTVYDKIHFLHSQCLKFVAERERDLGLKKFRRLYLSTDRQILVSNWTQRADKRNCDIYGIASACLNTGYVFAFNFNFDGDIDADEVEKDALEIGDYEKSRHHRKYARIWLRQEFNEAIKKGPSKDSLPVAGNLVDEVKIRTLTDSKFNAADSSELLDGTKALPPKGALVHNEYTMMAHFFLLKRFFQGVEKTRFFMDLDSGMKAAYVAAFRKEVAAGVSDGFLIKATKNKTNDDKEKMVAQFRKMVSVMSGTPVRQLTPKIVMDVTNNIIENRLKNPIKINGSPERWIEHPGATKAEPEKMVAAITNLERYDLAHQANLYRMATLAPVDRFFMRIRRFSTFFERPFQSGTSKGRIWYGYAAYDPSMYTIIGDIFRVYYNYCTPNKQGKTPAMILGLAKGPVDIEKIIYFKRYLRDRPTYE